MASAPHPSPHRPGPAAHAVDGTRHPAAGTFRRILFIVPAQLGDVLLSTAALRAARERWPDAVIDVLGNAGMLALIDGNPDVDGTVELARSGGAGWRRLLRQVVSLWRRYDLALVARASDRAHLAGWIAAPVRSARVPRLGPGSRWKRWAAAHAFADDPAMPEVVSMLRLLSPWAEPPPQASLRPPPPLPLPARLDGLLRRPCVVVQVPSMWRYKQWPVAHFRSVVEQLLADGVQVVVTGSASPHDRQLVEPLRALGAEPDLVIAAGELQLRQLRSLLERADAYLGPDTSVTHLAAAVGVPIVTVFGPSLPEVFGPWPSGHPATQPWQHRVQRQQVGEVVVLQGPDRPDRPHCVPCNAMGCEHRHDSASHCLERLAPDRVLAELRRILGRPVGPT